jgi:hypothetical protein
MSITITTDIFCNRCGKWATGHKDPKEASVQKARRYLKMQGWKYLWNRYDVCPACVKDQSWEPKK